MKNNRDMHEHSGDKIVEKLTGKRAEEILNDKVKMSVLDFLNNNGPCSMGKILQELRISQAVGTKHILELKLLGLIDKTVDPPNYNIESERFKILMNYQNK